jgi:diguanylate cyclase (GGDEF)-like protein/PAS domain S-box-containing protein
MIDERDLRRLDDLLSRSPLAIVAWAADGRVAFWSERAAECFGLPAAEAVGKQPSDLAFMDPRDAARFERLFDGPQTPGPHTELCTAQRYGERRIFRWTSFDCGQSAYRMLSYAEDVTDMLAAQNALVESEERFRSLFELNPDIVMIFDVDGRVLDVNPAIARLGMRREAVIGTHYTAFTVDGDLERHEAIHTRVLSGETVFYYSAVQTPDGRRLDVTITSVPLFRDGQIAGTYSIVRDETDQRKATARIEEQQRELSDTETRLRSLFAYNPDGVVAIDRDGLIVEVNDAALRIGAASREDVVGKHFIDSVAPADRERARTHFARALDGEPLTYAVQGLHADGHERDLQVTLVPQYARGEQVGVYAIVQDVTQRRNAERRAEMQSLRIRNLYFIAASGDYPDVRMRASLEMGCHACDLTLGAVVRRDAQGPILEAIYRDPSAQAIPDEQVLLMAAKVASLPGAAIPVAFENGIAMRLDVAGEPYGALVFAAAGGLTREFTSTDADLLGLIATLIGGTIDRSRQRARLRAMAYYDALTGLPNRVFLAEKLRDAIEVAQSRLGRVAVLFLDLDRFKDVNDTLGHARGDRLLQMVAERFGKDLGEEATIARMGGDEFVVLLTDCRDVEHARDVAERLVSLVTEPFNLDDYEQFISTSIGIAIYPEDGRDDQTLIKNADIAMYRAKDRGRNGYYFYNPTLEAPIHMRLSQEKLLRRALEFDQFVVYYQPQLDLRTGRIISVEALVRWIHPKSGLIEPSHFIPSAEISGLIVPLGDWVLATAAKQVTAWHANLAPLRLAVNLSARQFHQRDLRKRVLQALDAAALDPSFLEVEITESVAMSDAAQTVGIVRDLKASGIRTAVDDFGTGYSSLAYLRRFALDVLKIDGSFVVGLGHEAFDETIVRTVIGMAHSLGLEVVAEGVETAVQLAFLRENGCDMAQGYALSPPLPAADFEAFLLRHREAPAASG